MKPQNPAGTSDVMLILKSFFKTLAANVSFGNAVTFDASGNGITFNQDNSDGTLIRVTWGLANTAKVINHKLGRRPIGYIAVVKNVACDVYSRTPMIADLMNITLYNTVASADTTLYIF